MTSPASTRRLAVAFIDLPQYRNRVYYWFSVVGIVVLLPFGVNNFLQDRPIMGWVVLVVAVAFGANIGAMRRHGAEGINPLYTILPIMMALPIGLYLLGHLVIFWCYPAIVLITFVLPPRQALIVKSVLLTITGPIIFYALPLTEATRALVTLLLTALLGGIFARTIETQHQELATLIVTDPLTGAYNRFRLDDELGQAIELHRRHETMISVVAIDLDHFKKVNDELGHQAGDDALREVARIVGDRLRPYDRLFRVGGEEFLLILPETGEEMGLRVAEDIRRLVGESTLLDNRRLTLSAGVTVVRADDTRDTLLIRADAALYQAKDEGRDRVVVAFN